MAKAKIVEQPKLWRPYASVVLVGMPGSGKTTFCVNAAQYVGWERTLWIHTERPINQYKVPKYTKEKPWGVVNAHLKTASEIVELLEPAVEAASKAAWLYDLVVFDGISENAAVNLFAIEEAQPTTKSGKKDVRSKWGDQLHDYQMLLWRLVAGQRCDEGDMSVPAPIGLGAHVIVTAHIREIDDPTMPRGEDGRVPQKIVPGVQGGTGLKLGHTFDQVLYCEARPGGEYRLYLKPFGRVSVKNVYAHHTGTPEFIAVGEVGAEPNAFAELLRVSGLGAQ